MPCRTTPVRSRGDTLSRPAPLGLPRLRHQSPSRQSRHPSQNLRHHRRLPLLKRNSHLTSLVLAN